MDNDTVVKHFERMGARIKLGVRGDLGPSCRLNVLNDTWGKPYFSIQKRASTDLQIITVEPKQRHLLLQATDTWGNKSKFLCGHDERAWFVAAIPESARGVKDIASAFEALKPPQVRQAQARAGLTPGQQRKRRTKAYIRQGEWFFIPAPHLKVGPNAIINRDQPIRRGRGKPHMVEEEYREGGVTVYVNSIYSNGVSNSRRVAIDEIRRKRGDKPHPWRAMTRDGTVYARGKVSHPDHATVKLEGWHRVVMNTEHEAEAMRHVAFLD